MKIGDFLTFFVNAAISTTAKIVRTDIDDECKQEIIENGLYHITPNIQSALKKMRTQHIRPASSIASYGKSSVFLFNGTPTIDNYMKNICNGNNQKNPYLTPNLVETAIQILPKSKTELANYKVRPLSDNVILFEGYCILPKEETKIVYLVPDLIRDKETGDPIINQETGKYDIKFRLADEKELNEDKTRYNAKQDYLKFVQEEAKSLGYISSDKKIVSHINSMLSVVHLGKIEGNMTKNNILKNLPRIIKAKIKQITTPKLDMSTDERISTTITQIDAKKKNPYRDKKFGEAVANFQSHNLTQLNLREELENLTTSENGKYFRTKYKQIVEQEEMRKGLHGINHSNRVALLSMLIAQKEGIFENDENNRTKDILLSAAYYQRKSDIFSLFQQKRSVKQINKKELIYTDGKKYNFEDEKILQAVIVAQQGKDKNMKKICKKYKIDSQDIDYTTKLMTILKDANALDRVRLDFNKGIVITDLDPKYLRIDTSKQLLNASYQLETLTKKVEFDRILSYKTDAQLEGGIIGTQREEFIESLKKGISQVPSIAKNVKTKITNVKSTSNKKWKSNKILKRSIEKVKTTRRNIIEKFNGR